MKTEHLNDQKTELIQWISNHESIQVIDQIDQIRQSTITTPISSSIADDCILISELWY